MDLTFLFFGIKTKWNKIQKHKAIKSRENEHNMNICTWTCQVIKTAYRRCMTWEYKE